MTEAYIYDAVRTPRGKGKPNGALHEITPVQLGTQVLQAIRDRTEIDTADVDDVVFGCVSPVGEQGGDIARTAVLNADYAETVAGVQINRFCASGLEAINMAAAQGHVGRGDVRHRRRRRIDEPRPHGLGRRRLGDRSRGRTSTAISRRRASPPT